MDQGEIVVKAVRNMLLGGGTPVEAFDVLSRDIDAQAIPDTEKAEKKKAARALIALVWPDVRAASIKAQLRRKSA